MGQDWGGLIGLRMVAENPERFARVVVANTGIPTPTHEVSEERYAWIERFRSPETPTPTLPDVMAAISAGNPDAPEQAFAHWQKWCWESEDLPVGTMIAGTIDGRTLTPEEVAAYDAPFPGPEYKMGTRAMPSQVPTLPNDPSVPANLAAWKVFDAWEKPFLCAFSDNDAVTAGADELFKARVPGAQGRSHHRIHGGGHFLQEGRGAELAKIVIDFVATT